MAKKTFILDTNILLSDPEAIFSFQNNNIVLPLIVCEELDRHKDRQDEVGRNARETVRKLAELTKTNKDLKAGIPLPSGGLLKILSIDDVRSKRKKQIVLPQELLMKETGDNSIISLCLEFQSAHEEEDMTLVSRDLLLRLKADVLGIKCEDYKKVQVTSSVSKLFSGVSTIEGDFDINELHRSGQLYLEASKTAGLQPNEFVVLTNGTQSGLCRFFGNGEPLVLVSNEHVGKIKSRNKEQTFAIDLLTDPDVKLVTLAGFAGCGKAQPLTAKILTPTGWITMGDVQPGTKIIGKSGKPISVLSVFPQGEKEIYEISFSDGSKTRSCKEHLWETSDEEERINKTSSVKSLETIMATLKGHDGRKNHSIPLVEEVEFELNKTLSIHPYVLGALLGDGGMSVFNRVSFTNADEELIKKVSELIPESVEMKKKLNAKYDFTFKSKIKKNKPCDLVQSIQNLGLAGKKSHEKFIPPEYKFSSVSNRKHLIQGLIDTDGYICNAGTNAEYYTTSYQLALDVKEVVESLSGIATINRKQTKYSYLGEQKFGKPCWVIRMSFFTNFCPASLSRKVNKWVEKTKYKPKRYISNISYVGKEQAQCILVDAQDHLYITDDFIVTHNTLVAIAAGLEQVMAKKYKSLVVCRPVQPVGKDIGFLPGTIEEKMEPWIAPIKDNLRFLLSPSGKRSKNIEETLNLMFDDGIIEIQAMTFIRGRSIADAYMIIDEAQNLNAHELKTILTRVGEGTKIVLTGDIEQIDNMYVDSLSNGLTVAIEKFKSYPISGHVTLLKGERSELATLAAQIL